jgi:hypothetical protein
VETIKSEYQQNFPVASAPIRDIGHRFISIDYPSDRIVALYSTALREKYQDNILIINMSEREYDPELLPGHVLSVNFRGLPSPPLELICRLCLQIHQWLSRSPSNVVAVHCFPGLSRTAVLISCYLAWCGKCIHPVDALLQVCSGLKIDVDNEPILPSQKRYLNYFFDYLTSDSSIPVPAKSYKVSKLILNGVPSIPIAEESLFRPFFEIWSESHLVYSSLPVIPSEEPKENLSQHVPAYPISKDVLTEEEGCTVVFDKFLDDNPVILRGDILVRIRHLGAGGGRYTCLRFAFNTNYVQDGLLHFARQELDGNTKTHCVVDLVMIPTQGSLATENEIDENKRMIDIFKRSKDVSSQLRQGLEVSEYDGDDIEEVIVQKASNQRISSNPQQTSDAPAVLTSPAKVIGNPQVHDMTPTSGDDVDDFFAQLEKEAQI